MKSIKLVLILLITALTTSCESKKDIQSDIDILNKRRLDLQNEVLNANNTIRSKQEEIQNLNERLREMNIYLTGKTPRYVLKVRLKQSRLSLDIGKHIKDAMNAIEFEIPVDREFYNSVKEGTRIVDNFRTGSLILYGSIGSWNMTVLEKTIK